MKKYLPHRKGPTLMPAVALATLAALVAIPTLSSSHLYAASPERASAVTVRSGDSLWTIAERATPTGGSVTDTIDSIVAVNHLGSGSIVPGERLRIPRL